MWGFELNFQGTLSVSWFIRHLASFIVGTVFLQNKGLTMFCSLFSRHAGGGVRARAELSVGEPLGDAALQLGVAAGVRLRPHRHRPLPARLRVGRLLRQRRLRKRLQVSGVFTEPQRIW